MRRPPVRVGIRQNGQRCNSFSIDIRGTVIVAIKARGEIRVWPVLNSFLSASQLMLLAAAPGPQLFLGCTTLYMPE